jgi:hypothetical protein
MADEIESVTTSAPAQSPGARPGFGGLSPLTTGLLYGGAATAVGGPLGLLVGLGFGLAQKRMRDSFLDREARYAANIRGEHATFNEEVTRELEVADPDEKRLLEHAKRLETNGWYRLQSGDESGREMIDQANLITRGIMQADQSQRKQEEAAQQQFQRGLIGTAANDYRSQYQQTMDQVETTDNQASRVLDLAAQPDFDPNAPFNKAAMAELLSTGIGGLFRDAPDAMDAVTQGASGLGALGAPGAIIAAGVEGISTFFKSKDFKISREDYNRIALNMKKYAEVLAKQRIGRLGEQSQQLEAFARQVGAIPADYSLGQYVSGGVKELRLNPVPQYQPPRETAQPIRRRATLPTPAQRSNQWNRNQIGKRTRPTN